MGNLALSPQLSFNGLLILSEYSFLTHFAFDINMKLATKNSSHD